MPISLTVTDAGRMTLHCDSAESRGMYQAACTVVLQAVVQPGALLPTSG